MWNIIIFEIIKIKILKITIMTRSSQKGKGSGGEREGKGVREEKGERGKELSRLDPKHQKYRLGHSVHCRVLLCKSISDFDS